MVLSGAWQASPFLLEWNGYHATLLKAQSVQGCIIVMPPLPATMYCEALCQRIGEARGYLVQYETDFDNAEYTIPLGCC